jgi:hypothetical protein
MSSCVADKTHTCPRCFEPRPQLGDMTPWDYFHSCANLGKYDDLAGACSYFCACNWVDEQELERQRT